MAQDSYPIWQSGESTYRTRSAVRGLPWWILLAIIVSIGVHIGLYIAVVELPLGDYFVSNSWRKTHDQDHERIQISPDLLREADRLNDIPLDSTPESEVRETDLTMVDQELDLLDAQENMPDKEVKLTPEVSEVTNFLKGEGDEPSNAGAASSASLIDALEAASASEASVFEADISALKKSMLAQGAASENQKLLDISDLEESSVPPDTDLFKDLSKAEVADSGGVKGLDGFNTLDGLLGRAGKLPGNLDPVLMPTDLLFGYDEDQLREGARLSLMKLGLLIQKNPDSDFIIEGHTDSYGSDDYNLALSNRRATAVRDWLTNSLRLPTDGIRVRGYGKAQPLADPAGSREAQALNRRVEIVIRPKD